MIKQTLNKLQLTKHIEHSWSKVSMLEDRRREIVEELGMVEKRIEIERRLIIDVGKLNSKAKH